MKKLARSILSRAVQNDFVWRCFDATVCRAARLGQWARSTGGDDKLLHDAIAKCFPDRIVRHGPFKGMTYLDSSETNLAANPFAKLLGSYEHELESVWEAVFQHDYADVINVGCAEGYYAVGCAMRLPKARVYAYDVSASARMRCRRLAELNSVVDRIILNSRCTHETLASFPFRGRSLVISDCEGFEKQLFCDEVVAKLAEHDVLIEAHDFVDVSISATLHARFHGTHEIQVVQSFDDIRKAYEYDYPELKGFELVQRRKLLAENRPTIMQWLYLRSNRENPSA